jgi:citrate synthase
VRKTGFEGVTARLWSGGTAQPVTEANVRAMLGAARERAFARLPELMGITRGLSLVDGFRAAIAGLRAENGLTHEATIVGAFPVIAGALVQRTKGGDPVAPDPTVSHAADTLSMLLNRSPTSARWPRSTLISSRYAITA